MPIDPAYLSIRPIETPSPLQSIGSLMQMRNLSSEVALRQQQVEESRQRVQDIAAQAEQRNRDLDATRKLGEVLKDPAAHEAFVKGDFSPIWNAGVAPNIAEPAITSLQNMQKSAQAIRKEDLELHSQNRDLLTKGIAGLGKANPDGSFTPFDDSPADTVAKYNSMRTEIAKEAPALAAHLPDISAGPDVGTQLANISANNLIGKNLMDAELARQEQVQKVKTGAATAAKDIAQARESAATAAMKEAELGGINQDWTTTLGKAGLDPDLVQSAQAAIGAAPTLQGKLAALDKAIASQSERAKAKMEATDPAIRAGKAATAAAVATADEPSRVRVARETGVARAEGQIQASGATEDDFSRAGQQYAITGIMPPLGMGSAGRMKVEHYAQEFARQSGLTPRDLAVAQAAFKGDTKSLENFQKQRDQIVSFEQTAQKNLDLFLTAAAKIPDTGSPWLNAPLRTIDQKALGSSELAAVNAARQVANNEIAKVTSGGGLGGVLSDTARNEVKGYNPNDATFKQTLAVAKILRQDMANRHASMDATLGEIKNRIGTPGGAPSLPVQPAGGGDYVRRATGPNGHSIGQRADGGWYDVQTGAKVQ